MTPGSQTRVPSPPPPAPHTHHHHHLHYPVTRHDYRWQACFNLLYIAQMQLTPDSALSMDITILQKILHRTNCIILSLHKVTGPHRQR